MSNPAYEQISGGGGSTAVTPSADSPDVHSQGSFGRDAPPVSEGLLAYMLAVFTIGGTIALIQDDNPKAAWVIVVVVTLGMIVVNESRAGLIEQFSGLLRSVTP